MRKVNIRSDEVGMPPDAVDIVGIGFGSAGAAFTVTVTGGRAGGPGAGGRGRDRAAPRAPGRDRGRTPGVPQPRPARQPRPVALHAAWRFLVAGAGQSAAEVADELCGRRRRAHRRSVPTGVRREATRPAAAVRAPCHRDRGPVRGPGGRQRHVVRPRGPCASARFSRSRSAHTDLTWRRQLTARSHRQMENT